MIAQVFTSKVPAGPISDEAREWVENLFSEARTHDGLEAHLSLRDPATGEAMTIAVFRDQAAMDAYQAFSKEKTAEAQKVLPGGAVPTGRVYSEVIATL